MSVIGLTSIDFFFLHNLLKLTKKNERSIVAFFEKDDQDLFSFLSKNQRVFSKAISKIISFSKALISGVSHKKRKKLKGFTFLVFNIVP